MHRGVTNRRIRYWMSPLTRRSGRPFDDDSRVSGRTTSRTLGRLLAWIDKDLSK
jgi:hypothetical protein